MLLSHLEWLCIILPTLIAATPRKTVRRSSGSTLPGKLEQDVPACAQPCIRTSLAEQFPLACTVPADLNCLCSRYSFHGESLGEVALGCIYASCYPYDRSAASAYNICLGQRNAVPPTLSALTVVARSSSVSMTTISSRPVATTSPSSTITSTISRPTSSSIDTVVADSVSLTPSPTSTPSQTSVPALPADNSPPKMKPAQIAGLSVAAAAAFIIAIGLMALSVFLRRRRERKNEAETSEKRGLTPSPRESSREFSREFPTSFVQAFPRSPPPTEPPPRFPMQPAPLLRRPGRNSTASPARDARTQVPFPKASGNATSPAGPSNAAGPSNLNSVHPLLRPALGPSNNSSSSSVPLDQIGLAISAELPGNAAQNGLPPNPRHQENVRQQTPVNTARNVDIAQRPVSAATQETVFEEDDVRERRRESKLLPTPPFPIPPIRAFQPSRPPPKLNLNSARQVATNNRQLSPPPELFLDIPVRHSRSQPMRIGPTETSSRGELVALSQPAQRPRLAPAIQISRSQRTTPSTSSSREPSNGGDIPDYYFIAHEPANSRFMTPEVSPHRHARQKDSPKVANTKPKHSSSNVSRTTSRGSTNIRDSISSQTSFETVDPNDPTPDDEDDVKRLERSSLSPVAESPISNLRYPRVPRASNQLVPRSPRSPQSRASQDSLLQFSEPSSLLVKRRGEQRALQLGSPIDTGSPRSAEARDHVRRQRQHLRSNSLEAWSIARNSERSTRTQSSLYPKSPVMYEPDMVQPLNVRSRQQQQQLPTPVEMQDLKSPLWVPRLTPRREGDDLLISVTYSNPGN